MSRIRFNIASLLVVVVVFAVGIAALRDANDIWDSGLFTLTLGVLLISILFAIHRAGVEAGFLDRLRPVRDNLPGGISLVPSIDSRLATTKILAYLDSKVPGRTQSFFKIQVTGSNHVQAVAFSPQGNQLATSRLGTVKLWDATTGRLLGGWAGTTENFVRIGHSLLALLAGWFGGQLSRRLWRASKAPEPSTSVDHSKAPVDVGNASIASTWRTPCNAQPPMSKSVPRNSVDNRRAVNPLIHLTSAQTGGWESQRV